MTEINKTNLTDPTKFRLNEITKIEHYFNSEINQKKSCSKKLSKYVATFDYIDKILAVSSAASRGFCIISSMSVVGATVGMTGASSTLIFSLTTGIIKNLLSIIRHKRRSMIIFLCWLKVN